MTTLREIEQALADTLTSQEIEQFIGNWHALRDSDEFQALVGSAQLMKDHIIDALGLI